MDKRANLSFRRGDLLAIALVVVIAAAVAVLYLPGDEAGGHAAVQIYQDGRLIRELPLDADATLTVSGAYTNTIAVQNGRAAVVASDCPGEDCVHSGWISSAPRSIACLPNRVEIRISGAASDVDFAVR